jgi:hypothetical protein
MKAGSRHFAALCAFVALWICASAQASSVRAWLDRTSMQLGETVTLNVQVNGDTQASQPDFSALTSDFDLTGTQSSTSMNIVNGRTSSTVLWAVGLSPKHAGTFTIPALTVDGAQTRPLTLTVLAAAASAAAPGGDAFVEAVADPPSPYVQQQVRLTVKLYYAVNLIDGNLAEPQATGAMVRKLGQDSNYTAEVGGRTYRVVERHYALLPENSGTVTVSPIVFRGHAMDAASPGFFFNNGRAIGAQSQPITLDVRPRPAASGTDAWLPARSMTLTASGVDARSAARVGDPLTLDLRLEAQGLGYEQLPKLELPKIDGADVYPDKPVTQNRDDGQWLYGTRERKFAIVPNRAGPLTLPPISVGWWDTAHDRAQTVTLPAVTLNVAPTTTTSTKAPAAPASDSSHAPAPPAVVGITAHGSESGTTESRLWQRLAIFALALWALTLAAWIVWLLRQRRRRPAAAPKPAPDSTAIRHAFADACMRQDLTSAGRSLLEWARQTKPQLRNLGELAQQLGDPAQAEAIGNLERVLYGTAGTPGLAGDLARVFARGPAFVSMRRSCSDEAELPELYSGHT